MIRCLSVSVLIWAMAAAPVLAEYGQGPAPSKLYPMLIYILLGVIGPPILVVLLGVRALMRHKKRRDAEALMEKLAAADQAWDLKAFEARALEVFRAVAPVSTPEALDAVKDMFTPHGAAVLASELAEQQQAGKVRRFELNDMIGVELLRVDDRLDDREDRVWALIRFYGFDHWREATEPASVPGGGGQQQQIWKFRRAGDEWLLESFEATSANAVLLTPGSTREKS